MKKNILPMRRTPLNRRSKTPKCKECKQKFTPLGSELFCSDGCRDSFTQKAIAKANKNREKAIKKAQAESKREIKAMAEKAKTHGEWEEHLEGITREITRLIDKGWNCISCTRPVGGYPFHASHYHSVGANNSLRYNLFNQFLSCSQCNTHLSGNITGYDEGLLSLFGAEIQQYVKFEIVRTYPLIKLSIEEIKEKIKAANAVRNELKKADSVYSKEERISLRRKYNEQIGIYSLT